MSFSSQFPEWNKVLDWAITTNEYHQRLETIPWTKSALQRHQKYLDVMKELTLGWNTPPKLLLYNTLDECKAGTESAGKEYTLNSLYKSLTSTPKLNSTVDALQEVLEHVEESSQIDFITLEVYRLTLNCEPWQVLCFLLSIYLKESSDFTDVPSHLLCTTRGLPYRANAEFDIRSSSRPAKMIQKPISFLLSTGKVLHLYVKEQHICEFACLGYPIVIPTSLSNKQRVIVLNNNTCKVLSITPTSITEIGEFEVESNGDIGFMEAYVMQGKTVLHWGGGDCIRGVLTWSYCTGLTDDLTFHEIDTKLKNNYRAESLLSRQDFTLHGNLLSVRSDTVDGEENGKRKYKSNVSLLCEKTLIKGSVDDIVDAWGSPQQHLVLTPKSVITVECGFLRSEVEVVPESKFVCALHSLSRLTVKKNAELLN